ncbi:NUDIX hydrolase [Candidatus Odyssella thessalonicensis]|uniref:NUDIX hydrolase n=1 Tax=Candidatus Odyssella thessalonicensis TaxID=84647 RepID=UPI000225BB45|nr:NUDIX hydrolase [Candidatus Odyssella thessalonicensis]
MNEKRMFSKAVEVFKSEGKFIPGIVDLLVRGTGATEESQFDHLSDLDLSVIVKEVSANVLKKVSGVYNKIKEDFPYKLSITVVSQKEYISNYHHHGIKPLTYSYSLPSTSKSLLGNLILQRNALSSHDFKLDTVANMSYLIHDLRQRRIKLNPKEQEHCHEFLAHITKRAKHFIRNALFLHTGQLKEEIDIAAYNEYFNNYEPLLPDLIRSCRQSLRQGNDLLPLMDQLIDKLERLQAIVQERLSFLFSVHPIYIPLVECAIEKDQKFLLIVRPSNSYAGGLLSFPGGKVDYLDQQKPFAILQAAVRREVEEELGLILIDSLEYVTSSYFSISGRHYLDTIFHCVINHTSLSINPNPQEVEDYMWLSRDEIFDHKLSPPWLKEYIKLI